MISNHFFLLRWENSTLLCNPWQKTLTIVSNTNNKDKKFPYTESNKVIQEVDDSKQTTNKPAVTLWTAYSKSVVSTAVFLLRAAWSAASLQMFAMSAPNSNERISHTLSTLTVKDITQITPVKMITYKLKKHIAKSTVIILHEKWQSLLWTSQYTFFLYFRGNGWH